jgi:hypothetical protein
MKPPAPVTRTRTPDCVELDMSNISKDARNQ